METIKRIIKNVLGKTQAECKAKLAAAMEAAKGVDISRADEYTVATWLRCWYEIYAKPNIRISTANRYRLMIEQYAIPPYRQHQAHQADRPRPAKALQGADGERSYQT